jgi:Sec7-like guanine-nucleotide exchange factor
MFLEALKLPGEAQKIDRITEVCGVTQAFAKAYFHV